MRLLLEARLSANAFTKAQTAGDPAPFAAMTERIWSVWRRNTAENSASAVPSLANVARLRSTQARSSSFVTSYRYCRLRRVLQSS